MRINQKDRFCHISEIIKDNWQYPTKDFYAHLYSSVLPETIKNAINIENGLTVIGSRPVKEMFQLLK